jgi:hypothetical protein
MSQALAHHDFECLLDRLLAEDIDDVALADDRIRGTCAPAEARTALSKAAFGSSTNLAGAVAGLLDRHEALFVLTDADGVGDLPESAEELAWPQATACGVRVLLVRRQVSEEPEPPLTSEGGDD